MSAVRHLLRVDAASPSAGRTTAVTAGRQVGAARATVRVVPVHVVVRLRDHLVRDRLLLVVAAEDLLEHDDQGQDEGDFAEQQGLAGDQGDFTEDERQQSDQFELEHHQQRHQVLLVALLLWKN